MSEQDRAVARSCLSQIETGMSELRGVDAWWATLGEVRRQEWKDFAASVSAYRRSLESLDRVRPDV